MINDEDFQFIKKFKLCFLLDDQERENKRNIQKNLIFLDSHLLKQTTKLSQISKRIQTHSFQLETNPNKFLSLTSFSLT